MIEILLNDEDYLVEILRRGNSRLLVIFASAGLSFSGDPIPEFRKTTLIEESNVSICWVVDKKINWYNSDSTNQLISILKELMAVYENITTIGESMGGCAALYFGHVCNVTNVVAFGPQYSILTPFINFNSSLSPFDRNSIVKVRHYGFEDLASKALIIFGGGSWQDLVHANFFERKNFRIHFLKSSGHSIANELKRLGLLRQFFSILLREKFEVEDLVVFLGDYLSLFPDSSTTELY